MNRQDPDGHDAAVDRLNSIAHRRSGDQFESKAIGLDTRLSALAGLAAALAVCSPFTTLRSLAEQAMAAGVTAEEMLGVLMAVGPTIGTARVVANTPTLALALGYNVDAALECTDNLTGE